VGKKENLSPVIVEKSEELRPLVVGVENLSPNIVENQGKKISHVEILENFSTANVDKLAQRHEMLFLLIYPHQVWISL
jgi:hypothetical protein